MAANGILYSKIAASDEKSSSFEVISSSFFRENWVSLWENVSLYFKIYKYLTQKVIIMTDKT